MKYQAAVYYIHVECFFLSTHWSNVLLYRYQKVEIGVVICLRFFHGKNKNMVTKKISDEKVNSFLSHLKL